MSRLDGRILVEGYGREPTIEVHTVHVRSGKDQDGAERRDETHGQVVG